MSAETIDRVVILGRDAPLWLAACVVQAALQPSGVTVTAVELPSRLRDEDVYVSLPALEALHHLLRIDEATLLAKSLGAFSLGQNFVHATGGRSAFFHAYGSYGAPIDHKPFFAHWTLARRFGLNVMLEDFSLTAAAAKHGRMLVPDAATQAYGRADYGYHLPAICYASVLKQVALHRGVRLHEAMTAHCELDARSGDIAALLLSDERRVDGQFFIDASGEEALLLGAALGVPRESWRQYFPADRSLIGSASAFGSIPPYAEIRAGTTGWCGLVPSRARTHAMHVYSSQLCSDDAALGDASTLSQLRLERASVKRLDPGPRVHAWERNCVAIGSAACAFDPIHSVELQALHSSLVHLLALFPVHREYAVERVEFNRLARSAFERLRDYQSAYYLLNGYDSAFWDDARGAQRSPELAHKIDTFRARGDVPLYEHETFPLESWQALFVGHGVLPETDDPLVQNTPPETMKTEFRRILGFIRDKVEEQTTHDFYLQSVCAAR